MGEKKGFIIYHSLRGAFETLTDEDKGQVLMAMFDYSENGTVPELTMGAKIAFSFIKPQMDVDIEIYKKKCEKNSGNINKRWGKYNTTVYEKIPNDTNVYQRIPTDTNVYQVIRNDTKNTKEDEDDNDLKEISPNGDTKKKAAEPHPLPPKKESAEQRCKSDYRVFGEFEKVKLLETEYSKLAERMGKSSCEDYIARLDGWLAEGNSKKNHYATILNWWRRDESSRKAKETSASKAVPQREEVYGEDLYADVDALEV